MRKKIEVENKIEIRPQKGKQEMFLSSSADICIYGGAAGQSINFATQLSPSGLQVARIYGLTPQVERFRRPQKGKQEMFLSSSADICIYGPL